MLSKRMIEIRGTHGIITLRVMKEWTGTDVLLKKDGLLYCCELVPNAEIIEQ